MLVKGRDGGWPAGRIGSEINAATQVNDRNDGWAPSTHNAAAHYEQNGSGAQQSSRMDSLSPTRAWTPVQSSLALTHLFY